MFDKRLLTILACPLCKGSLTYQKKSNELWCLSDRLAYPISDGIPVMLAEEARRLSEEE